VDDSGARSRRRVARVWPPRLSAPLSPGRRDRQAPRCHLL